MTGHFILRPRALRDVEDIWDYTIANWGARQAESYVQQVNAAFQALAENPNLGSSREHIRGEAYPVDSGSSIYSSRDDLRGLSRLMMSQ